MTFSINSTKYLVEKKTCLKKLSVAFYWIKNSNYPPKTLMCFVWPASLIIKLNLIIDDKTDNKNRSYQACRERHINSCGGNATSVLVIV